MITALTEETFASWIVEHHDGVILGWMENCTYCEQFKPVFQSIADDQALSKYTFGSILITRSGSDFKRLYMRANIGEKSGAPCTFLFRDGKYVARQHGLKTIDQLRQFIVTGDSSVESEPKTLQQSSIIELKAYWLDQILAIERSQSIIRAIQTELGSRNHS